MKSNSESLVYLYSPIRCTLRFRKRKEQARWRVESHVCSWIRRRIVYWRTRARGTLSIIVNIHSLVDIQKEKKTEKMSIQCLRFYYYIIEFIIDLWWSCKSI